jgi:hypothetical protein
MDLVQLTLCTIRESFDAIIDFFLMEIESQPRGRDNLFVEHVLSQDETAAYVWRMTKRLRRHYDQHGLDGTEYSFRAFQKAFKKGNFRQSELGTLASMLLCVPGMSHTEAVAIARANPTPTGLVDTLHHFEEQQQAKGSRLTSCWPCWRRGKQKRNDSF